MGLMDGLGPSTRDVIVAGAILWISVNSRPSSGGQLIAADTVATKRFEVVTIKPTNDDASGGGMRVSPSGLIIATNVTIEALISYGYGVPTEQISGGPAWMRNERYSLMARSEPNPTREDARGMMRTMLEEELGLVTHRTTKQISALALRVARAGKTGSQLRRSLADCAGPASGPSGKRCGFSLSGGRLVADGMTMAGLAQVLAGQTRMRIDDQTGLTGMFDIELKWAPLALSNSDDVSELPSLSTAIEEQLGLKFQREEMSADVLVVDKISRPKAE